MPGNCSAFRGWTGCASLADPVAPPARVVLHVGAHKTASTHFSELVWRNPALLAAHDVSAPQKTALRERVTQPLTDIAEDSPVPAGHVAGAQGLGGGARSLLVMDENIIGTPRGLFSPDGMYPRAAMRLGRAARLFPGARLEVMLAIRDPRTFVAASWSESLRSNTFIPFRRYLRGVRAEDISWLRIVRQMQEAVPEATFTIWRFEDYRHLQGALLALALGGDPAAPPEFSPLVEPVRVGLSGRALEAVALRVRLTGQRLPDAEIDAIMARFPKGKTFPAPQPWSSWEQETLSRRYAEDVAALSDVQGVRLLSPVPA